MWANALRGQPSVNGYTNTIYIRLLKRAIGVDVLFFKKGPYLHLCPTASNSKRFFPGKKKIRNPIYIPSIGHYSYSQYSSIDTSIEVGGEEGPWFLLPVHSDSRNKQGCAWPLYARK